MIGEIRDESKLTTTEIVNPATPRSQYQNRPSNMTTEVMDPTKDGEVNGGNEMRRDAAAGTVIDAPSRTADSRTADRMQE